MTDKRISRGNKMGEPVNPNIDLDIEVIGDDTEERVPGLGWMIPQETVEAMRDIDESIRSAEQMSGNLFFG